MRAFPTALLVVCALALSARAETLDSISRPQPGTWSVDTTGRISSRTLSTVNEWGAEIDRQGQGQLAVAVVSTTGGQAPRAFALELFNRWGIGHATRDDGTLLFIALDDRKVEIILGDGVDSGEDTQRSDALMSGEIIPAFKRGNPDAAVLAGARGLIQLLRQSPLNTPPSPAEPLVDTSGAGLVPEALETEPADDTPFIPPPRIEESFWTKAETTVANGGILSWGAGAGGLAAAGLGLRRWLRRRPRHCADCKSPRMLLNEKADDAHLDEGQRKEEKLGSVDYDVWWCAPCQDARVERYSAWFSAYGKCPGCSYRTKAEKSTTLRAATYDSGGTVRVDVHCKHCDYRDSFTRSTPKLTRPSSSSSSSSSSRSSGFGGGRSSGGGSSGSW